MEAEEEEDEDEDKSLLGKLSFFSRAAVVRRQTKQNTPFCSKCVGGLGRGAGGHQISAAAKASGMTQILQNARERRPIVQAPETTKQEQQTKG